MRPLTLSESQTAFDLIQQCFRENANFNFLFSNRLTSWRFKAFIRSTIRFAYRKKGAFISDDGKGIAFIWAVNNLDERKSPIGWWQAWWMLPFGRLFRIARFQKDVAAFQPKEPHLFFMLLAIGEERSGVSTIIDIRDKTYALSSFMQLPIFAQTSSVRTKVLYERYGFETYGALAIPGTGEFMYFLKRPCHV